jgi:putative FmdB family regulatory protein
MPIYEYQSFEKGQKRCGKCRDPFEVLQKVEEQPLKKCPACGAPVRRLISWCRAAVAEAPSEHKGVEARIKDYESSGMWSHAAELADKHSEKVKDKGLKMRALDNYKKAGYDVDSLAKHAEQSNE